MGAAHSSHESPPGNSRRYSEDRGLFATPDCLDSWMDSVILESLVATSYVIVGRQRPDVHACHVSSYDCGDPPLVGLNAAPSNADRHVHDADDANYWTERGGRAPLPRTTTSRAVDIIDPSTGEKVLL